MDSNCLSEIVFEFIKLFSLLIDIVIKTIIVSKYFRKQFPIILKVCQMTLVPQKRSIVWVQEIFESTDPFRLWNFIQFEFPFNLCEKSLRNIAKRFKLRDFRFQ